MVKVSEMFNGAHEDAVVQYVQPFPEPQASEAPIVQISDIDRARASVTALSARVQSIVAKIPPGKIESDAQAHELSALLVSAKVAASDVETARKAVVKPLNDQVKAINDLFRPLSDALAKVSVKGDPLVLAWIKGKQAEQERARLEARRLELEAAQREVQARVAAENAKTEAERHDALVRATDAMQDQAAAQVLAPLPIKGVMTEHGRQSIVRRWVATVTEPAKLPREYLVPDQRAIDDALAAAVRRMRAAGRETPEFDVPGVTVEEDESLRRGRGL